ncbi:hypothetical protein SLA2020_331270 [Shorea laevis]
MSFICSRLQEYSVETAVAVIADGGATLRIDAQHLRDLNFRVGSIYQFIGELHIQPDNEIILQAHAGRNVDGISQSLSSDSAAIKAVPSRPYEKSNNLMLVDFPGVL